ncbi:MAG: hypothetical protein M3O36_00460 [Myxococcota bacterium]|nr:hypothetical protein [Myxococcota bacterium]
MPDAPADAAPEPLPDVAADPLLADALSGLELGAASVTSERVGLEEQPNRATAASENTADEGRPGVWRGWVP